MLNLTIANIQRVALTSTGGPEEPYCPNSEPIVNRLLPGGGSGTICGWLLAVVWMIYPASLVPTQLSARRAGVGRQRPTGGSVSASDCCHQSAARWPVTGLMAAGSGVMVIAAGPTMLAVPLTEQLHGRRWIAAAAVTFSLGTLLSTAVLGAVGRRRMPVMARWPLWGLGMLAGWTLAPEFAPMVLAAQFLAGVGQGALEGDMDTQIAADAPPGR
ncbi:hypothetical protein HH310_41770 [Actinoplanes sp. TBRC 11911]|uniref:hypothetical protein n=1 Tax=Actinoplanes sp. TBRC 11911 TaxID=2729386 RepID=UPI00145EDBBF|nr:hypothetical protein [Actinoplanes sp. TBRC 11911]NMO57682.1 hypothetical protein [Actinoplanes sp. TBRC 11911]